MSATYKPIHPDDPTARLLTRILVDVLEQRGRADLLERFDRDGGRFEEHPAGVELYVGDESVIVVTSEAIRLGFQLQPHFELQEN